LIARGKHSTSVSVRHARPTIKQSKKVMGCCRNNKVLQTKYVELTFLRSELLYDIKNIAYVEGDLIPSDGEHNRHQTMDVGEDGNIDIVTRKLNLAYTECLDALYPYTNKAVECGTTKDDVLQEPFDYVIAMQVPEDFSQTTVEYMENLIHDYLVTRVLIDWLGITHPDRKTHWLELLQGIEEKLEECKNRRIKRVRRTLTPW